MSAGERDATLPVPGPWPRIVTVVRPAPAATEPPFPHAWTVEKPVVDRHGYIGFAVELPDVYRHTEVEAQRILSAAVGPRRAPSAPQRRQLVAAALAHLQRRLPATAALLPRPGGCVLRLCDATLLLQCDRDHLAVSLPRWRATTERIAALRHYAARLNADARLCRLELRPDTCGFTARLPLLRLCDDAAESLATATLMACHALLATARATPALPTLLDAEFQTAIGCPRPPAATPVPVPFAACNLTGG